MTRSEFIEQLEAIVKSDRHRWIEGAFERATDAALQALSQDKPLIEDGELMLDSAKRKYPLPKGAIKFITTHWGDSPSLEAYDPRYPGVTPRIHTQNTLQGRMLVFSKAPTPAYTAVYGRRFRYEYSVSHRLTDTLCTLLDEHLELFTVRALAALMSDLVAQNVTQPIQLHKGLASMPANSTPSATYGSLMKYYKELLLCSA